MNKKLLEGIDEFSSIKPASKIIKNSLRIIAPIRGETGSVFSFSLCFVISVVFSFIMGMSEHTVSLTTTVSGILLTIILAVFGILFTVYSIILAFMNDSYIKKLVEVKYKESQQSYLFKSISYYESVLFLYFIGMCITGVVYIFTHLIDDSFLVTRSGVINGLLATIFLLFYFVFCLRILYEIKSVIYNTIILFRSSVAYKLLSILRGDDESNDNNQ